MTNDAHISTDVLFVYFSLGEVLVQIFCSFKTLGGLFWLLGFKDAF